MILTEDLVLKLKNLERLTGNNMAKEKKKKKSIIQSIIDIPKTIRSNNAAIKKISKKMAEEKRYKDKMSRAKSKAFSESLKDPRKLERLDDKIKENAKKVAEMRMTGQLAKGGKVLKPVDKSKNPGLAKLPTQVRNKMGYMKKGGRVMLKSGGIAKKGRGCEIR